MKKFKLIGLFLCMLILSGVVTFALTKSVLNKAKNEPVQSDVKTEDLYQSRLILSQLFEKCGHTMSDFSVGTVSYSSADELKRRYPGYKITAGQGEELILTSQINSYCPHHYFASLTENEITISRLSDNTTVSVISIDTSSLSEQEKKLLAQGLTLESEDALTSFIEDFTS